MGKFSIDPPEPRQTFSHARTKPLIVEKVNTNEFAVPVLRRQNETCSKTKAYGALPPLRKQVALFGYGNSKIP
jgi:hypothetical protein